MTRHTARYALTGPPAWLPAWLPALAASTLIAAVVATGVAIAPAYAGTGRGWGGGGDANANNLRTFLNNGWNNRTSFVAGSMRNLSGIQQIDAGVDASVNTQASNCRLHPGCGSRQRIWGRNTSAPVVRGGVWNGRGRASR